MLLWSDDFRAVFWFALLPGVFAVALLIVGVREPERHPREKPPNPVHWRELKRLSAAYWWVVGIGALFSLARFSEAFLVLRVREGGLPLAWIPLVLVAMNLVYAVSAYPFGRLSDRMSHTRLLVLGLVVLIGGDLVLAAAPSWGVAFLGIALWGLHMGITQGLLATMVAASAPANLRGTAFGFFNLLSGVTLLIASALAGLLWDRLGSALTFYAGVAFCVLALTAIALRQSFFKWGLTSTPH